MASVRTYAIIYVLLMALGTSKFVFFEIDIAYQTALALTIVFAIIKAGLIAGFYQHLLHEPRSITYVMASAVFAVFLLTIAAGYSIQP